MQMHPIYAKPDNLPALQEACYSIAKEAHSGIGREKIGGSIPYITHPAIVYKILKAVGVSDPIALCAAFLHDVIEDCPWLNTRKKLSEKIFEKLESIHYPDAEKYAFLISELCGELTNAKVMEEGKRGWQYEHGQKLSMRAKQIKIADQIASFIDDIVLPSSRPNEKLRKFNLKALECAKACLGDNPLLDNLFKVIFTDAMIIIDAGKADASDEIKAKATKIRDTFTLEEALDKAAHYPPGSPEEVPVKWKKHPDIAGAKTGIIEIGLSKSGKVCRFTALIDPQWDENSPCNKPLVSFIDELESVSPYRTSRKPTQIVEERVARRFALKPAMELTQFISIAAKNNALEGNFASLAGNARFNDQGQQSGIS